MDLTLPLFPKQNHLSRGSRALKARSISTGPSFHRECKESWAGWRSVLDLWDGVNGTPNRRRPGFTNGVKKQKLHDKNILNWEEIFKILPELPQQTIRTLPPTPSCCIWVGWSVELGFAAVWFHL